MQTLVQTIGIATVFTLAAHAQARSNAEPHQADVGLGYAATRANSPPGSCGCFLLQGASLDAAVHLRSHWSAALELTGNHATSVPGTTRSLSTISLLAGPRFTSALGNRHRLFAQSLVGAVRGFDAEFRRGAESADTATGFAYLIGGSYEYRVSRNVWLRPLELGFIQTNLPNGADGRQRNLRFGAGVAFRVPLGIARR